MQMNTEMKMAEINNNIPNFGRNTDKIGTKINNEPKKETAVQEEQKEHNYIPDTGILGRSQVKSIHDADIQKSIEEAVRLAQNNPALLCGCEDIFNHIYNDYIKTGMEPSEAYMKALLAEEELMEIGAACI